MRLKFWRLTLIYTLAALTALSCYAYVAGRALGRVRLTAGYASARAFESAVTAAEGLSDALRKLSFVGDEALGKNLCAQACADALAARTALSILPFDTQELEKLEGFLGRVGDYAQSLCALPELTLPEEHREHLRACGEAVKEMSVELRDMQAKLHEGSITMDTGETPLRNVEEGGTRLLSASLLGYESSFTAPEEFAYEGRFSPAREEAGGTLSPEEALALAAKAAEVEPRELREEYGCEGPDGRRCYSAGGLLLGVSSRGLEYMGRSRLVGAAALSEEQARERAEAFLARMGYADLALFDAGRDGNAAVFRYAPTQDGVMRPDDALRIVIALDDGSVHAFDATAYSARAVEASWDSGEQEALATLPEGVQALSVRRLIVKTPGGNYIPCWELNVQGGDGESARVCVDARTGRQCRVELG